MPDKVAASAPPARLWADLPLLRVMCGVYSQMFQGEKA